MIEITDNSNYPPIGNRFGITREWLRGYRDGYNAAQIAQTANVGLSIVQLETVVNADYRHGHYAGRNQWGRDNLQ